ncbi:sigma-70 family RNA polymerase sigma factor [Lachnospira multipara]|uniref:sigma-70 family RNA polymerase sigma factor n=1 Tax=Lachnospira multipara TaxID=28051 RepID=UPI0004E0E5D6|nr:sigma-70 family RNA polymerase sigma factor [Lachnospira multipara]
MDKLTSLTDEALVEEYRNNNNQAAASVLYERYKDAVTYKANTLFLAGGDVEDLIQEGMIGLVNAVRDFDPDKNIKFTTFANICIERQILNAITASNRQKNKPLNTYVSLDSPINGDEDEETTIGDNLKADDFYNPEYAYFSKEEVESLRTDALNKLSDLEVEVFNLNIAGNDYKQIAKILGKSPKSIDNALTRIKRKIKM